MDNRSLATDRPPEQKGGDGSGLSRAAGPVLERLAAYKISDRFAAESPIGLPWNQ
jgi:hypothetical protein